MTEKKKRLNVGDKLYYSKDICYTIKSVGNKYYSLEENDLKIPIDTLLYEHKNYSQINVQLYETLQEVLDYEKYRFLEKEIWLFLGHGEIQKKLSLQELESIAKILKIVE